MADADGSSRTTARLRGRSYGRTFELRIDDHALVPHALTRLPAGWRPATATPERVWEVWTRHTGQPHVWVDADLLALVEDPLVAVERAASDLELWVAEHARRRVFVHAGCVAVDGRALLLPGRTLAGKSTLTAALVRAGATYYSDEYAVLDSRGRVRPYPRPLRLRPSAGGRGVPTDVAQLGGVVGRTPLRPAVVALLQFHPEASWAPRQVSAGEAVLGMLENTVAARTRPRAALNALTAAADGVVGLKGERGDADEAAAALIALLLQPG